MDEEEQKKKEVTEKAETEVKAKAETDGTEETGVEKAISTLDRADEIAERQKRENDRREKLIEREEALAARRAVGGETDAGKPTEKPKELTDIEYAEALERGEVNPLKADGFIK